jgi:hypothetical protein
LCPDIVERRDSNGSRARLLRWDEPPREADRLEMPERMLTSGATVQSA